ncbi:VCBS repeat-containing protein [Flammeovirga sp. EKP202]|uniref:VCBS repeat-containing protein n=1 Tax=Flammeovirga sp. EKP202 TaxID=2770592 RepID=UPI00165F54A7|nr:VCBS repeat-containing protein [Flammeovirga sp. EKP202]MBD0401736.1 VCBS repeat-containing protein [Flammeovirga sp. EKP202]
MKNIFFYLFILTLTNCSKPLKEQVNHDNGFHKLDGADTGINFENNLSESDSLNYFTYPYLYMGGGVAIFDCNNDGLEDLFLTANQVENRLYLNKGELKFEDITSSSQTGGNIQKWYNGVSIIDINNDGFQDIYVSVSGLGEDRKNELYINNGDLTFTEKAEQYGIADNGDSYQGYFFDYDLDGDLDLLVINYPPTDFDRSPGYYRYKMDKPKLEESNHFFKNENGKYVDITEESGLLNFDLTISAALGDFNNDGYIDIYLSNDFASPDYLFLNQKGEKFIDVLNQSVQHTSFYSMGSDVVDINNDGYLDLIQLDMSPADNYRSKANMASMNIPLFWDIVKKGLHYQYMHNALQLNAGIKEDIPMFSEVSHLANIHSTDWSWASLSFDYNNDGWSDFFISNGVRKDINNRDFFNEVRKSFAYSSPHQKFEYTKNMPSEAIQNYLYTNLGNLDFENSSDEAGLTDLTFSNGASYGDLDNDGDLDLVINNIDSPTLVYENKTKNPYLELKLKNHHGIGTKVTLYQNGKKQYKEHYLARGYLSSVTSTLHFGLHQEETIDSVVIEWEKGVFSKLTDLAPNQLLSVDYKSISPYNSKNNVSKQSLLQEKNVSEIGINYTHIENKFDDYSKQILLPHKMSQFGPAATVADFNNDGLDDIYIGGAHGQSSSLFLQKNNGLFTEISNTIFQQHQHFEDVSSIAFDVDNDGDLDLLVLSGGNEFEENSENYLDRLYLNNGQGEFDYDVNLLPSHKMSGGIVKTYDYNKDGYTDILIGNRHRPHQYPLPASSLIYKNAGGKFIDVTHEVAPDLREIGMVTDAEWVDINEDGLEDFIVVGEWMEPKVFTQNARQQFELTEGSIVGFEEMAGWWYSIEKVDIDNDGDMDLLLGNLGENYKYKASNEQPFKVFTKDFDQSGSQDIVLSYSQDGDYYPVRGKQCSSQQLPALKKKFETYDQFAKSDLEEIYKDFDIDNSLEYKATTFASILMKNEGGKFVKSKLPNYCQISSINDYCVIDINNDEKQDIIYAGNMLNAEVETTRNDASYGGVLLGNSEGTLECLYPYESGLFANGEVKQILPLTIQNELHLLIMRNNNTPILYLVGKEEII